MGMLTAIAGIVYASWMRSATTVAGSGLELDAIAAAFVGGTSVSGGVGKITGSIIGALVMASLVNGMNLLGMDISYQHLVRAGVLAAAVIFDVAAATEENMIRISFLLLYEGAFSDASSFYLNSIIFKM
jgi:putative multiple sugar transport system permease protein